MQISKIKVVGFRLLAETVISPSPGVTVIVGQNNSGKTSLTEICRRMLSGSSPAFRLEDFSLSEHPRFLKARKLHAEDGKEDGEVRPELPTIRAEFEIDYSSSRESVGLLGDLVIDLEEDCAKAIVRCTYALKTGAIKAFFEGLPPDTGEFFRQMSLRVPKYFSANFEVIDPNDPANTKAVDQPSLLSKIVACDFIGAQRALSDETASDKAVIGKILESLFQADDGEGASEDDKASMASLKAAVTKAEAELNSSFNSKLDGLINPLKTFGYPRLGDPGMRTKTELDVEKLLSNHTSVGYHTDSHVRLPESFNGLGPRNLIVILLKLVQAYKSYAAAAPSPAAHLVFIEEPEAHLHPQMQEAFIRHLERLKSEIPRVFQDHRPWPAQFLVTTHSSHIANEAPFRDIRYFKASDTEEGRKTEAKDLSAGLGQDQHRTFAFLHKYMTLTRCDLLFADMCVLVEGTSERLFLPSMITSLDASRPEGHKLGSRYLSVVEVGGAYANEFFGLIRFLELRTLVITDIDSVAKKGGTKAIKVPVHEGTHTSNATIKGWFGGTPDGQSIGDLIAKTAAEKEDGVIRIAYQVPETAGGPCGRSLEDAFILANPTTFNLTKTDPNERGQEAYDLAAEMKKAEFAITHGIMETNLKTPRYIAEGLEWLAGPLPQNANDTNKISAP